MYKATVKSCSCQQCKFGKLTDAGHFIKKQDERAARRQGKVDLKKGVEAIPPAHRGKRIS